MARIPEPEQTPDGPSYEGRLLDRPDEEVVDQGAGFDIKTLVSRRGVLSLVGVGVGAATLAACAPAATSSTTSTSTPTATSTPTESATATPTPTETAESITLPSGEIPDETAGPYPGDGSNGPDVLEESGIVRSDITTSIAGGEAVAGVPLTFTITVTDMANADAPFEGVAVYAWHCDAQGLYSMYSEGVEDETWLRGVQIADANGEVTFTSILPGCYLGRWTHIHFEVYPDEASITDSANAIATSQIAFPQEVLDTVYTLDAYAGSAENLAQITLDSDNVFGEDGGALQMATVTGDTSGYVASLVARVDTTTEPTAGAAPEGGGGQPPA
ncbi:intradiol ring-cleavage dioxygenase [Microbacterium gilvum]|uniref:Intradiol ring-cleavage dioxygenase n=1 Tax=Microbacterium gilvum TaxID=1336204 RepID=A0ABP9A2K6_9MICO